jgi:hypothetical protein
MSKVPAELVDLLQALFDQGELSRALEREDWSVELVKHLRPAEHATPDAWFHGVVRLAAQRDELPELLAVCGGCGPSGRRRSTRWGGCWRRGRLRLR